MSGTGFAEVLVDTNAPADRVFYRINCRQP
jgi:hypothetical protein